MKPIGSGNAPRAVSKTEGCQSPGGNDPDYWRNTLHQYSNVQAANRSSFKRWEGRASRTGERRPRTGHRRLVGQQRRHVWERPSVSPPQSHGQPAKRSCTDCNRCRRVDTVPVNLALAKDISTSGSEDPCGSADASNIAKLAVLTCWGVRREDASDAAGGERAQKSPRRKAEPAPTGPHQCASTVKTSDLPPITNLPFRQTVRTAWRL